MRQSVNLTLFSLISSGMREAAFGSHSRIVFCCEKLMTLILDIQIANPMCRGGRPNTPLHWAWAGQPSLPGQVLAQNILQHGRFHPLIPKNCVNLLFRGFHSSFLCPTTQSGDENRCGAHVRGCVAACNVNECFHEQHANALARAKPSQPLWYPKFRRGGGGGGAGKKI